MKRFRFYWFVLVVIGGIVSAPPSQADEKLWIDGSSGARQSVVVGTAEPATDNGGTQPAMMAGINEHLLEKSRYGLIPMVADGLKPFAVYAADTYGQRLQKFVATATSSTQAR